MDLDEQLRSEDAVPDAGATPARPAPGPFAYGRLLRTVGTWIALAGIGAALLYGRYDWSTDVSTYSETAYLLSLYLLVLTVPTVYYLAIALLHRRNVARVLAGAVFLAFSLPYRWLGLDRWFFYSSRPYYYTIAESGVEPRTEFLPGGLDHLPDFPHERLFFAALALLGLVAGFVYWQHGRRPLRNRTNGMIALLLVMLFALLAQTFLHTSMRSPYTYVPHYEQPAEAGYWYQVYMFPGGKGAVNADQPVHAAIEQYFHGTYRDANNMLMRRPYAGYVTSQFSYFVNSYYIYVLINLVCWFAAVVCGYQFARRLVSERTALLFAALIATGTGFILFVANPASYMVAFALVMIILYLFERLIVETPRMIGHYVLFAAVLGAFSLVYDFFPMYPVLLAYGWVRKVDLRWIVGAIVGSLVIYGGFLFVHNNILGLTIDPQNIAQVEQARDGVIEVLKNPSPDLWYAKLLDVAVTYPSQLARMFFIIPVLLALVGACLVRSRAVAVLSVMLFLVTLATVAFMRIGGQALLGNIPRLTYPAYPAVYLLAAIALDRIVTLSDNPRWARALRIAPWVCIALLVLLNNVDAFGYPTMYYEAVHNAPPAFVP